MTTATTITNKKKIIEVEKKYGNRCSIVLDVYTQNLSPFSMPILDTTALCVSCGQAKWAMVQNLHAPPSQKSEWHLLYAMHNMFVESNRKPTAQMKLINISSSPGFVVSLRRTHRVFSCDTVATVSRAIYFVFVFLFCCQRTEDEHEAWNAPLCFIHIICIYALLN